MLVDEITKRIRSKVTARNHVGKVVYEVTTSAKGLLINMQTFELRDLVPLEEVSYEITPSGILQYVCTDGFSKDDSCSKNFVSLPYEDVISLLNRIIIEANTPKKVFILVELAFNAFEKTQKLI